MQQDIKGHPTHYFVNILLHNQTEPKMIRNYNFFNLMHLFRVDFKNWKDEDDDEEDGQGQDMGKFIFVSK